MSGQLELATNEDSVRAIGALFRFGWFTAGFYKRAMRLERRKAFQKLDEELRQYLTDRNRGALLMAAIEKSTDSSDEVPHGPYFERNAEWTERHLRRKIEAQRSRLAKGQCPIHGGCLSCGITGYFVTFDAPGAFTLATCSRTNCGLLFLHDFDSFAVKLFTHWRDGALDEDESTVYGWEQIPASNGMVPAEMQEERLAALRTWHVEVANWVRAH